MTYTPRLTILFAALALSAAACGDNEGAEFDNRDRVLETAADLNLEEITVDVIDSCRLTQIDGRLVAAGLNRIVDSNATDAPIPAAELDKNAEASSLCNVSRPFDAADRLDELAPDNVDASVCGCDYEGCIAEAITDSFGCDVCATFQCGDFDRHGCALCD